VLVILLRFKKLDQLGAGEIRAESASDQEKGKLGEIGSILVRGNGPTFAKAQGERSGQIGRDLAHGHQAGTTPSMGGASQCGFTTHQLDYTAKGAMFICAPQKRPPRAEQAAVNYDATSPIIRTASVSEWALGGRGPRMGLYSPSTHNTFSYVRAPYRVSCVATGVIKGGSPAKTRFGQIIIPILPLPAALLTSFSTRSSS